MKRIKKNKKKKQIIFKKSEVMRIKKILNLQA